MSTVAGGGGGAVWLRRVHGNRVTGVATSLSTTGRNAASRLTAECPDTNLA
jgi:hypothetical protein